MNFVGRLIELVGKLVRERMAKLEERIGRNHAAAASRSTCIFTCIFFSKLSAFLPN
jgi:hypothetical protein